MMCSRLSSSPVTAARTKVSETGRSTSTTEVARYRFGRYSAKVTADASTEANTTSAISFRRRRISSDRSSIESSCVENMSRGITDLTSSVISHCSSGNDDDVAGLHDEVRLNVAAGHFAVVEGNAFRLAVLLPENDDAVAGGEVGEPLRQRDQLEHGGRALQLIASGRFHRADHR